MLASTIISAVFEVILLKFSAIDRENIVKRYQGGESVFALCSELNVSRSTIYNWIKEYGISSSKSDGTPLTPKTVHLLEKRIKKLEAELEIWKRCGCTLDSPLREKLIAIEKLVPEFGVHAPCRVLGVLRSTYYHHALRRPEQTMVEKEDELFRPVIKRIFEDTQGRLGAKKIRSIMITQGYTISPERISRLMKEMGLVCTSVQKGIRYNFVPKGRYYHNRLKRVFQPEHPNQAWVSDITMLYVKYERYYRGQHHSGTAGEVKPSIFDLRPDGQGSRGGHGGIDQYRAPHINGQSIIGHAAAADDDIHDHIDRQRKQYGQEKPFTNVKNLVLPHITTQVSLLQVADAHMVDGVNQALISGVGIVGGAQLHHVRAGQEGLGIVGSVVQSAVDDLVHVSIAQNHHGGAVYALGGLRQIAVNGAV